MDNAEPLLGIIKKKCTKKWSDENFLSCACYLIPLYLSYPYYLNSFI